MKPTCVELIIQALIAAGTLAVALVAIWGDWFRSKFAAPKLKIELVDPVGTILRLSDLPGIQTTQQRHAFWVNAKVVNLRRWTTPKNCRVLLRSLAQRGPDNVYEQIPLTVPLQYVWSPSQITPSSVDIPHEQYFDFGCIAEHPVFPPRHFRPMLYSYTNDFRGYLQANQSIRYSLQIQADNFASENYQVFEVSWDGEWNSDITVMRVHIKIREIKESQPISGIHRPPLAR
jgi:hypothetical protein